MRVLVTGGAGFIGSHVVDQLAARGDEVVVLDNLSPHAHHREPDYLNPAAEYQWADIADPEAWKTALRGVDAVSHQAAMVGLGVDFSDVRRYVDTNDAGLAVGLQAMHASGFRGRLVLASSMVVYGEGAYRCTAHGLVRPAPRSDADLRARHWEPRCASCGSSLEAIPLTEEAALDPRNVYAATKLHQEHLCRAYAREHGNAAVLLRYHNVYGPRMPRNTPYAGIASIFRSALDAGRPPQVFEDGAQRRDFIHVSDVATANLAAIDADLGTSEAFNIATGRPHSILDMARALHSAYGAAAPAPEVTGDYRLGDVRHIFASPMRAERMIGFRAAVAFTEGMRELATAPLREPLSLGGTSPASPIASPSALR